MTVAVVTNSITPYTHRLYDRLAEKHGIDLTIFQCVARESARQWVLPKAQHYRIETLKGLSIKSGDVSDVHINPEVVLKLSTLKPEVVVACGFTPSMAAASLYSMARSIPFGLFFGGSLDSDKGTKSLPHALLRRLIVPRASFACCPNEANRQLVIHWGMDPRRTSLAYYPMGWDPPRTLPSFEQRPYDLLLSGSLVPRKNPLFFADVARRLAERGFHPRVRVVGTGPLRDTLEPLLEAHCASVKFDGYLQQHEMADAYSSARLVLFPTLMDDWGLVANEAVSCGTPIIASPNAVSSHELVEPFGIGLVRDLDVQTWCDAVLDMLSSEATWASFMKHRDQAMDLFALDRVAAGFAHGIALGRTLKRPGWRGISTPAFAAE